MDIRKSSRHQKIIGCFGEYLIANWLSRSGFEVSIVDHIGIDIIAYNPVKKQRLGITVKSRTRNIGTEETHVNILSYQRSKNDRQKLLEACKVFACEPWIAIYVETSSHADLYLTSLENYDKKYRGKNKMIDDWKMTKKYISIYEKDDKIKHIRIEFYAKNWSLC